MEQYYDTRKYQFSTFLGAPHHPHHVTLQNATKRMSYAAPGHTTHGQGPHSSDFLFGAPRFQERYRSNSMDSILVQDMSRQVRVKIESVKSAVDFQLKDFSSLTNQKLLIYSNFH